MSVMTHFTDNLASHFSIASKGSSTYFFYTEKDVLNREIGLVQSLHVDVAHDDLSLLAHLLRHLIQWPFYKLLLHGRR